MLLFSVARTIKTDGCQSARDEVASVALSPAEHRILRELAEANERSVSGQIRYLIRDSLLRFQPSEVEES